jgi:hypothetical protein
MTCRTTPSGRLATTFLRQQQQDLPDSTITSLYHQLQRKWRSMTQIAQSDWQNSPRNNYLIHIREAQQTIHNDSDHWRGGVRERMQERLNDTTHTPPTASEELWAFCELGTAGEYTAQTFQRAYDTIAATHHITTDDVRTEFQRLVSEYTRAEHGQRSSSDLPDLLAEFRGHNIGHQFILPNDPATRRAFDILLNGTRCETCGQFTGQNEPHACPQRAHTPPTLCPTCRTPNSASEHSCEQHMDDFQELYDVARANINAGQSVPTDRTIENIPGGITGGLAAPGGMSFGLEIEIDFPDDEYPYEVRREFARRLYEAGVAFTPNVERWRYFGDASDDRPEQYQHGPGNWVCEFDRSVDPVEGARGLEVKSQILHDTPETWNNLRTLLNISESLGGQATSRTGLHVNIGIQHLPVASPTEPLRLLRTAAAYDDLLIRLGNNPSSGANHRGRAYCQPVTGSVDMGQAVNYALRGTARDYLHRHMFNLSHLTPNGRSEHSHDARIEGRGFDGVATTSDLGRIQAAVAIHCALVHGAAQGVETEHPVSPAGTQRSRYGRRRLTGEEWQESTRPFRNFIGYLNQVVPNTSPLLHAQLTHMFAVSRWQHGNSD